MYLSKKIAIPHNLQLEVVAWNSAHPSGAAGKTLVVCEWIVSVPEIAKMCTQFSQLVGRQKSISSKLSGSGAGLCTIAS